jgi:hypothetical protein
MSLSYLSSQWNPSWSSMPWKAFTSPVDRFQVLPSFVMGEFVFISLALATLLHAQRHGRLHLATWLAALVTGTANDAIFMMLPMVDNFWQSQACIMMTPRMPLYIPCVYIVFMYTSTVAVWRLGLPLLPSAALTGLMGEMIYSPYDITGAKYLWWTWHDTDAPVRERLLGAPVGSSAWVVTFTASFQLMVTRTILATPPHRTAGLVKGVALTGLLSTPIMVVQMSLVQLVTGDSQGLPTVRSLIGVVLLYLLAILLRWSGRTGPRSSSHWTDKLIATCLALYYTFLAANMFLGRPEAHISSGVHQEVGDCSVTAEDVSGHLRQVYLCRETHTQDWTLDCRGPCREAGLAEDCATAVSSSWYTVCGLPHSDRFLYTVVTAGLGLVGTVTYCYTLLTASTTTTDRLKKQG